jgi:hypothetical protein
LDEAEWQACTDPARLLVAVRRRATDRQLRLFAAGCCRLVWDKLPFERCREAVLLGESYADDLAGKDDLEAFQRDLNREIAPERGVRARLAQASACLLRLRFKGLAERVASLARTGRDAHLLPARQCDLLRDIMGHRLRLIVLSPFCRTSTVCDLAQACYDTRDPSSGALDPAHLAILADALEEADSGNATVLAHLRQERLHWRGCWVVDLVRSVG